jgi:hypothetical protein
VRLAPFPWRCISKPLSLHTRRTDRLRRRTASPPEFLPQSRRSRLRRHQHYCVKVFPLRRTGLQVALPRPRGYPQVSPYGLQLGRFPSRVVLPPDANSACGTHRLIYQRGGDDGCRMRLEMGPELQAARGVPPKQKFWRALGRLSRSSPSQSTFFNSIGHCPLMQGTWIDLGDAPDS